MLLAHLDRVWFSAAGRTVRAAAGQAVDVMSPSWCVGCTAAGEVLCGECAQDLRLMARAPFRAEQAAEALPLDDQLNPLPVFSAMRYSGIAADVIMAFKERERIGLRHVLAHAVRRAMVQAAGFTGEPALLIWPPASHRSMVTRGRHPLQELLKTVPPVPGLEPAGHLLRARADLRQLRALSAQKGRSALRRRHRSAPFVLSQPYPGFLDGQPVVLLDDVLTTGSTVHTMHRVLTDAGAAVQCAAVLAATPRPARRE